MHWQKALCDAHKLKGRVLISPHGINGTLGGPIKSLKSYIKAMNAHSVFKGIDYKWSAGGSGDFPKASVKVRKEIVTFGIPDDIEVDQDGIVGGGVHLKPEQVHKLVEERGDEVIFMDGRNAYEAAIGKFKNAVTPNTTTTKDFVTELKKPEMNALKERPIVTYCTGGIRCEILTSIMKKQGFKDVYQIDGGIAKYGEIYKDEGFWEGKLYVFDKRMNVGFSDKAVNIGSCSKCRHATSNYENCAYNMCSKLTLVCKKCTGRAFLCNKVCQQKYKAVAA